MQALAGRCVEGTGKFVRIIGDEVWTMDANGLNAKSEDHYNTAEYERQLKSGAPPNQGRSRMPDLNAVFIELKSIMGPYAAKLDPKKDDAFELYVDTKYIQKNKKPLFFGAVQIKKAFVSYHLMPVYTKPELLAGLSPGLKARMQGKSCFNFAEVDKPLFKELAALTQASFASYKEQGFL